MAPGQDAAETGQDCSSRTMRHAGGRLGLRLQRARSARDAGEEILRSVGVRRRARIPPPRLCKWNNFQTKLRTYVSLVSSNSCAWMLSVAVGLSVGAEKLSSLIAAGGWYESNPDDPFRVCYSGESSDW